MQASFHPNPSYISLQPHINHRMRAILVDWLVLVQVKFNLLPETLYLTVSIIDRFLEVTHSSLPPSLSPPSSLSLSITQSVSPLPPLSIAQSVSIHPVSSTLANFPSPSLDYLYLSTCIKQHQVYPITKDKLQLVGVTAMLIASKYEEIYFPQVQDFSYITDHSYSEDDIRRMEQFMLQTIGYRLGSPAAIHFLRRFSKLNQVSHIVIVRGQLKDVFIHDTTIKHSRHKIHVLSPQLCALLARLREGYTLHLAYNN